MSSETLKAIKRDKQRVVSRLSRELASHPDLAEEGRSKVCIECDRELGIEAFSSYTNRMVEGVPTILRRRTCARCLVSERRKYFKQAVHELFGGYRCSVCGYDKNRMAICFHHRDPLVKDHTPSNMMGTRSTNTLEAIKEELSKCEILCFNCHQEEHARLFVEERSRREALD